MMQIDVRHCDLVGAILMRNGRILLGRRSAEKREAAGHWDVIGGRVEPAETFEEACVREIQEELAVHAEIEEEVARRSLPSGGEYRIFRVTRWSGEPRLANDEHSELGWFELEEAADLTPLASEEYVALFRTLAANLAR